jgi:hypothetical protein
VNGLKPLRPALDVVYGLANRFALSRRAARWVVQDSDYFADRACLISFPKCGRTWLRLMMGKALAVHGGIDASLNDMLALKPITRQVAGVPEIHVNHESRPHEKRASELSADKREFRHKRVILLIRDVRDVMVSMYFQNTRRASDQNLPQDSLKDIDAFVRSEIGSLESFLTFYRVPRLVRGSGHSIAVSRHAIRRHARGSLHALASSF